MIQLNRQETKSLITLLLEAQAKLHHEEFQSKLKTLPDVARLALRELIRMKLEEQDLDPEYEKGLENLLSALQ